MKAIRQITLILIRELSLLGLPHFYSMQQSCKSDFHENRTRSLWNSPWNYPQSKCNYERNINSPRVYIRLRNESSIEASFLSTYHFFITLVFGDLRTIRELSTELLSFNFFRQGWPSIHVCSFSTKTLTLLKVCVTFIVTFQTRDIL